MLKFHVKNLNNHFARWIYPKHECAIIIALKFIEKKNEYDMIPSIKYWVRTSAFNKRWLNKLFWRDSRIYNGK